MPDSMLPNYKFGRTEREQILLKHDCYLFAIVITPSLNREGWGGSLGWFSYKLIYFVLQISINLRSIRL